MKKLDRINELVDELNELKLGCMAASLDSLYHSKSFDELDAVNTRTKHRRDFRTD